MPRRGGPRTHQITPRRCRAGGTRYRGARGGRPGAAFAAAAERPPPPSPSPPSAHGLLCPVAAAAASILATRATAAAPGPLLFSSARSPGRTKLSPWSDPAGSPRAPQEPPGERAGRPPPLLPAIRPGLGCVGCARGADSRLPRRSRVLLLRPLLLLRLRFGFGSCASALRLWRGISKTHRLVDLAGPAGVGRFLCCGLWLLSPGSSVW